MADLIAQGSSWLRDRLRASASKAVTYRRGEESATVSATIGLTTLFVDRADGSVEKVTSRDFLIGRDELGSLGDPRRGDRIEEEIGGDVFTFEAMAPDGAKSVFSEVGGHRDMVRVHTKSLGVLGGGG